MRKNQLKAALTKKGSFNAYPFSQINDKIVTSGLENIRAGQFISFVVKIKAQIFSATKIVKVEIIKNNKIVYAVNEHTNSPDFEIEFEDKNISNKEEDFYYLRVTETEGEKRVWSSPIWVNKGG